MKNYRYILICVAVLAAAACSKNSSGPEVETGGVDESDVVEQRGPEILFTTQVRDVGTKASSASKGVTQGDSTSSFLSVNYEPLEVAATKASAISDLSNFCLTITKGADVVVEENMTFSYSSQKGAFAGQSAVYWPLTDESYHFYAANHTIGSGGKVTCDGSEDIVCAYLGSPTYKSTNALSFTHAYARIGTVTVAAPSQFSATFKSASITCPTTGTVDVSDGSWSAGPASAVSLSSSDNDKWVVPGNYTLSITYDVTVNGTKYENQVMSGSVAIEIGYVNNITARVIGKDEDVTYGTPTITVSYPDDITAAGMPSSPVVTYEQSMGVTMADGTVIGETLTGTIDNSAAFGDRITAVSGSPVGSSGATINTMLGSTTTGTVSAPNLECTVKERTKVFESSITCEVNGKNGTGTGDVYQAENKVVSLNVTLNPSSIAKGQSSAASAMADFSSGSSKEVSASYTSRNTSVATVSGSTVYGAGQGSAVIEGTYEGVSGSATLTVGAPVVDHIEYGTPTVTLTVSDIPAGGGTVPSGTVTYSQTRTTVYSDGSTKVEDPVTEGGTVTYGSPVSASTLGTTVRDRSKVGTLTASVTLNGKTGSGSADVYQEANAKTGTEYQNVSVSISASRTSFSATGGTSTLTYSASYEERDSYTSGSYSSWSSNSVTPEISGGGTGFDRSGTTVTVSPNTGSSSRSATYTASFSIGDLSDSDSVTLTQETKKLSSISISPASATIKVNETQSYTVTAYYDDNTSADVTSSAEFTSSSTSVATMSGAIATGKAAGTSNITASYTEDGVTKTTSTYSVLTVTKIVTSVEVTPADITVKVGGYVYYEAIAYWSDGTSTDATYKSTWASSNTSVGVNGSTKYKFDAVGGGTATISATYEGVTGTATLNVAGYDHINLSPASTTKNIGGYQTYTATLYYTDGSTKNITYDSGTTFSSDNTSVAAQGSSKYGFEAVGVGTAHITATYGGLTSNAATFTVTRKLSSLTISPTSATIKVGGTQSYTVTAYYDDNTSDDVTSSTTFSVQYGSSRVSMSGATATGQSVGAATIKASYTENGVTRTATSSLTVTKSLSSISISPTSATIKVGGTQSYTVKANYDDGSSDYVTSSATITSSNTSVATVSGNVATGVSVGSTTISASYTEEGVTETATSSLTVTKVITSVTVTPADTTVKVGGYVNYTATAHWSDGSSTSVTYKSTWASSNTSVGVNGSTKYKFDAVGGGTATISATYEGVTGTATLNVAGYDHIDLSPASTTKDIGGYQTYTATLYYTDGSTKNITYDSGTTFSSDNTSVAAQGSYKYMFDAVGIGTAHITATYGGLASNAATFTVTRKLSSLTISPTSATIKVGGTQNYTATAYYDDNTSDDVTSLTTFSVQYGSSHVSMSGATATGQSVGAATIKASYTENGVTRTATSSLTVTKSLSSISISPTSATIKVGGTKSYTATANYDDGSTADVTSSANFESSNTSVATMSGSTATGKAVGTSNITASYTEEGVTKTSSASPLTVNKSLLSISISPTSATIKVGGTQSYTATADYDDGSTADVTSSANFESSNTSVATMSGSTATGKAVGTSNITASYTEEGVTKTSSASPLTVTKSLSSITITPTSATIKVGETQSYTVKAYYNDGTSDYVTSSATITSSNTSVAMVSGNVATGVSVGSTTISASYTEDGVTETATSSLTVTKVITSVTVSPADTTVVIGKTVVYTATAHWSDGSSTSVTYKSTWASSNTSVGTISGSGYCNAVNGGTATISATYEGVTGTATLNVAGYDHIDLSPASTTKNIGGYQTYTATLYYTDGSTKNITYDSGTTFSSDNTSVAAQGSYKYMFEAVGVGTAHITATYVGLTSNAATFIVTRKLSSLTISPTSATIKVGGTQSYTATADYDDGSTADVTSSANFESSNTSVATMSGSTATGKAVGTSNITASYTEEGETQTAKSSLTVTKSLSSITISPTSASIKVGETKSYTVTANYNDGTSDTVTSSVSFTVTSSTSCVTMSGNVATGVAAGTATITASYTEDCVKKEVSSSLTVTASKTLSYITITPTSATIKKGGTQSYTVTAYWSDSTSSTVTSSCTFTSSNTSVATIPSTGNTATGVAAGTSTITASYKGKTATSSLTVVEYNIDVD